MPDQPKLTLYAYWRTSAGYRVRVALALKGLSAEERNVDIDAGENRSPRDSISDTADSTGTEGWHTAMTWVSGPRWRSISMM